MKGRVSMRVAPSEQYGDVLERESPTGVYHLTSSDEPRSVEAVRVS